MTDIKQEELTSNEEVAVKEIITCIRTFDRVAQNRVFISIMAEILKERRNLVQVKKDEMENIEKDTEELRNLIVNVNSNIIQNERKQ